MAKKTLTKRWHEASLTSRILLVTSLIGGVTGSIIGIATAAPLIEPYWYVSRAELRQIVDKQAVATDRQSLFQLEEYLNRAKADPGAGNSPIVQQRIISLSNQVKQTKGRICKATGDASVCND